MSKTQQELLRTTFDQVPELYDHARPTYPPQVFADLSALAELPAKARLVEIGCGTGQATLPLAERGFAITCVELGGTRARARMNARVMGKERRPRSSGSRDARGTGSPNPWRRRSACKREDARQARASVEACGRAFLDLLATGYSVSAAASRVGLHRQRLYELRDRDAVFRQEWQQAVETGTDVLEQAAFEIATIGALEETFDETGRLVSSRRRQDPATVRFLLASRRPETYSEKTRLEVAGRVDVEHQLASGPVISINDVIDMRQRRELEAVEVVAVDDEPAEGEGS